MTDEMNKNLENEELELEQNEELDLKQLEGISGGLIVDCGDYYDYRVVDDKTGEILDSRCWFKEDAIEIADGFNVSGEVISKDEYKRRFGKDLDMSIRIDSRTGRKWINK